MELLDGAPDRNSTTPLSKSPLRCRRRKAAPRTRTSVRRWASVRRSSSDGKNCGGLMPSRATLLLSPIENATAALADRKCGSPKSFAFTHLALIAIRREICSVKFRRRCVLRSQERQADLGPRRARLVRNRTVMRIRPSAVWVVRIRMKGLLAVDLISGNSVLTFRRGYPIDELLAEILFDTWMLGRIYQHHAVLVA